MRRVFFFFLLALIAGTLGFSGIAGATAALARNLYFVFLVTWLILPTLGAFHLKSL